jgi:hypothetical protein
MKYTHDAYCNMLLTFGTFNSWADSAAWGYMLHYLGHCHPDVNVFQWLEQHLHETGSVMPTAHVNAGHPPIVQTPANEKAVIAAVEWEPWRSSHNIAQELALSQLRILKVFYDNQLKPYHYLQSARPFPDDRPLQMKFANGYEINTL